MRRLREAPLREAPWGAPAALPVPFVSAARVLSYPIDPSPFALLIDFLGQGLDNVLAFCIPNPRRASSCGLAAGLGRLGW